MTPIPILPYRKIRNALERAGFLFAQQEGSHVTMKKRVSGAPTRVIVVPTHREVNPRTLKNILKQAGLTVDEFLQFL